MPLSSLSDPRAARRPANRRESRILRAAAGEFAERGYAGARVERIAAAAEVNKQLVFYYFRSKQGLRTAVVEWAAAALAAGIEHLPNVAGTPERRLRRLLTDQFDFLAAHPHLSALLSREAADEGTVGILAPAIRRMVTIIAEGQGRGSFRADVDPHLLAAQALVLQLGYLQLEPVLSKSAVPLTGDGEALFERWRDASIRLILRGATRGA